MTQLIQIGNSKGIRIPKPLISQARLEGKELDLKVLNGGLFISPRKKNRQDWQQSIKNILATQGTEKIDNEWLDASLISDEELQW